MNARLFSAAILLAFWCALAIAQSNVYESKDKAGPVFSDQPSAGSKQIDVSPPNLMQGLPAQKSAPAVAAPFYTSVAMASPANEGTIHSNTGAFDIRVRISPALRRADFIKIKLDGNPLTPVYSSTKIHITAADWNGAAGSDNVAHTLQAAIVDRSGAVLLESAPVKFYAHRAAVRSKL